MIDIDQVRRLVEQRTEERVKKQLAAKIRRVKLKLDELSAGFFEYVATTYVGTFVRKPGRFGPAIRWKPLSKSWRRRKGNDQFFYHTGYLYRALHDMSADRLGKVTVRVNGKTVNARLDGVDLRKAREVSVEFVAFPKLPQRVLSDINNPRANLDILPSRDPKVLDRLFGPKDSYRALLAPALVQFLNVKLRAEARKLMRSSGI